VAAKSGWLVGFDLQASSGEGGGSIPGRLPARLPHTLLTIRSFSRRWDVFYIGYTLGLYASMIKFSLFGPNSVSR
jgi:hypothetical protein